MNSNKTKKRTFRQQMNAAKEIIRRKLEKKLTCLHQSLGARKCKESYNVNEKQMKQELKKLPT
jgi:hypothetical protein